MLSLGLARYRHIEHDLSIMFSQPLLPRTWLTRSISRREAALQTAYWIGTGVCNVAGVKTIQEARDRARDLTTINAIPLILTDRLDLVASALDLPRRTYAIMHRTMGSMTLAQMVIHTILGFVGHRGLKGLVQDRSSSVVNTNAPWNSPAG